MSIQSSEAAVPVKVLDSVKLVAEVIFMEPIEAMRDPLSWTN